MKQKAVIKLLFWVALFTSLALAGVVFYSFFVDVAEMHYQNEQLLNSTIARQIALSNQEQPTQWAVWPVALFSLTVLFAGVFTALNTKTIKRNFRRFFRKYRTNPTKFVRPRNTSPVQSVPLLPVPVLEPVVLEVREQGAGEVVNDDEFVF